MRKIAQVAVLATFLAGCFGPGELTQIPVVMPDGSRATIYTHNQQVPDFLLSTQKLELNFVVRNEATPEQLQAVASIKDSCRIYTRVTRPNELVAVFINGVLYGAVTAPFGGLAAMAAFPGAKFDQYAEYTGITMTGGGLANGIVQMGGKTYTFENCGREVLALFPKYGDQIKILHKSPY